MALSLSRKPPAVSVERAALESAIAAMQELQRRDAALHTAAEAADRRVLQLVRDLEEAQHAIDDARRGAVSHALAVATGEAPDGASPHAEARKRHAGIDAELVEARVARDALQHRLDGRDGVGRGDSVLALRRVAEAARAVLAAEAAPAAQRLAGEVVALERDLAAKARLLRFMVRQGAVPLVTTLGATFGEAADADVRHAMQRLSRTSEPAGVERIEAPWIAALAALQQDAAAPLPGAG